MRAMRVELRSRHAATGGSRAARARRRCPASPTPRRTAPPPLVGDRVTATEPEAPQHSRTCCGRALPAITNWANSRRKAERPAAHLEGFRGVLQVDGYAGFERLTARGDI